MVAASNEAFHLVIGERAREDQHRSRRSGERIEKGLVPVVSQLSAPLIFRTSRAAPGALLHRPAEGGRHSLGVLASHPGAQVEE